MLYDNGEEGERVHDQLPTVEQIHSKSKRDLKNVGSYIDSIRRKRKTYFLIAGVIIVVLVLSISIGVSTSRKRSENRKGSKNGNEESSFENGNPPDPTPQPTKSRDQLAIEFLGTVSSTSSLLEVGSSQHYALEWIVENDNLALKVPESMEDDGAAQFVSRYALAVLYYELNGLAWDEVGFLSGEECLWNRDNFTGTSSTTEYPIGVTCNQQFEPRSFNFPFNNLRGSLPLEIGLLTKLEFLGLGGNQIRGPLPSQVTNLSRLSTLDLYGNMMTGTIPTLLGSLSNLTWLSMSYNKLQGAIPDELGSLSMLKLLNFAGCSGLNGIIPGALSTLTNLESIDLSYNQLEGPIPEWIGFLPNLTRLRLSNNRFSSSIPDSLSNATQLRSLFLDDNSMTGDLNVIESLVDLELLLIEDNSFEQSLDSSFLASLDKLRILDASNNELKGSLPSHLFQIDGLQVLDLHGNQIEGNLPEFPQNNSALLYLSLYENSIKGSIPLSISNLKVLSHLDLSTNKLTGVLPASIGDTTTLTYLFLASNEFDAGPIPDHLKNLVNLRELSLKRTARYGNIPNWIGDLRFLLLLDLDDNNLMGPIPPEMGSLYGLNFLLLNRNQLTGTVPLAMHILPQLKILLLDNNDITGLGQGASSSGFCDVTPYLGKVGSVFTSDCNGTLPEIECPCCTECCENGSLCNDGSDFLANHDLIWEHGYDRLKYVFNDETVYVRGQG